MTPSALLATVKLECELGMSWAICTDERGLIHATVGDAYPGFEEALDDSVSALSPAGQVPELSTYWIDLALARLDRGGVELLVAGNCTRLIRRGGDVVAQSEYELFPEEKMCITEFIDGLKLWREAILSALQRGARLSLPEGVTYWAQRNPFPTGS